MSAFLTPVHFWMYDKIVNLRNLEDEMSKLLNDDDFLDFRANLTNVYGEVDRDNPLEAIIEHSNIHGWLQKHVDIVEARHAKVITKLLQSGISIEDILKEVRSHAKSVVSNIEVEAEKNQGNFIKSYKYDTPKEVFGTLNTYTLEGMPCDRVSMPLEETKEEFVWETTQCIHEKFWSNIDGDIANYYLVRNEWIDSFVQNLPKRYTYERYLKDVKTLNRIKYVGG